MNTRDVLALLPARLEWMVMFRLDAIARFAPPEVMRQMFFMPAGTGPDTHSHVALTSAGRYLAPRDGGALQPANDEPPLDLAPGEPSLLDEQGSRLATLPPLAQADCIGIGRRGGQTALLHVRLGEDAGDARALLAAPPNPSHYDLLPVVGVDYLGGEAVPEGWLARYRNRLGTHIKAGQLGGFMRTQHCNVFFIEQAEVGPVLARGLEAAFADRLRWARGALAGYLHEAAAKATSRPLAMRCEPPAPEPASDYGDLVPLGFLLHGMRALEGAGAQAAPLVRVMRAQRRQQLERHLDERRQGALWPFHTGRLVTATDSALVLLGHPSRAACEALERFADGRGGYLPQLAGAGMDELHMEAAPCNAHWRQADFATTCLVRGLRHRLGLPRTTPAAWIAERFDQRGALYFANPYLTDWCLAQALAGDADLAAWARRLRQEVLDSANPDGSFGRFDPVLSTALAVLCLHTLGEHGRPVRLAQVRLLNLVDAGPLPAETPFYSTFLVPPQPGRALLQVQGTWHALSLYRDAHRLVAAGLVAAALAVDARVDEDDPLPAPADPHPRYACKDAADYVARFALPPYLTQLPPDTHARAATD